MLTNCSEIQDQTLLHTAHNPSQTTLPEQMAVPHRVAASQQFKATTHPTEGHAFRGIGALFQDHQISNTDLVCDMNGNTMPYKRHQGPVPRADMLRGGIIQTHTHPDPSPMERFLLEPRAQQHVPFIEASAGPTIKPPRS